MEDKPELEKAFGKAATKARGMHARKILSPDETAELLGLFQQATVGDGNNWKILNDPKFFVSSDGFTKNSMWLPLRGMGRDEAMEKYIELVDSLMIKHSVVFPTRAGSAASLASGSTCYTYVPH